MLLLKESMKYVLFVFGGSWLLALGFYLSGGTLGKGLTGIMMPLIYMMIPAVIVIVLFIVEKKKNFKEEHGIVFTWNRWFVLAWFLPFSLTIIVVLVNLLFPGVSLSWEMNGFIQSQKGLLSEEDFTVLKTQLEAAPIHPLALSVISAVFAAVTINALFAFGEELFWRGYLYKTLQPLGFWKLSMVTGLLWGIWHAPLIMMGHNYPSFPLQGILFMTAWTVLISPIFTLIRKRSGSVLAPSILHGSVNAIAGVPIFLLVGGNELLNGWLGLAGFITLGGMNVVIFMKGVR